MRLPQLSVSVWSRPLNTVGKVDKLALVGTNHITNGGQNAVLKYTGFLTDNFTLSALYGHSEFKRNLQSVRISRWKFSPMVRVTVTAGTHRMSGLAVQVTPKVASSRTSVKQTRA